MKAHFFSLEDICLTFMINRFMEQTLLIFNIFSSFMFSMDDNKEYLFC